MKRIGAFSLAIFIFVLSVFSVVPVNVRADDDKTVIPLVEGHFGLTESDAQSKVAAHKDIYYDNDQRAFAYTPASSYNWTLCNAKGAVTSTHLSDKQVVALLCSSNKFVNNRTLFTSFLSNNNIFRGFMSGVGALFTGDSDNGTKFLDTLTGNYNYLDSLNYDEDSQTITMSNDNGSVDKLREEIKKYYYDSIGIVQYEASGTFSDYINGRYFSNLFEYDEDYGEALSKVKNYKYALADSYINGNVNTSEHAYLWDSSSYIYLSDIKGFAGTSSYGNVVYRLNIYIDGASSNLTDNLTYYYYYGIDNNSYSTFKDNIYGLYIDPNGSYYNKIYPCISDKTESFKPYFNYIDAYPCFRYTDFKFYSADGSSFKYFKSYSALYNYLHGDQNAYLCSKIEETGQDISYSIKDMNENLGSKMDELIDSINSGKGNMSADELQNAIDKGLEDLNKNTEDIKDNTSDILEVLKEQNNILLQILGVTEYIAYNTQKDDGTDYTVTDLKNVFNTMYNGLGNAILYGKNTVTDSGSSSGNVQKASFSVSGAASGASNDYVAVAAYSLDDDVGADDAAAQDINNMDIHDGLFGKFPFSVPYQLYEWLQVMEADPVAPVFVYNYGFLLGKKNDPKYDLKIDLGIYQSWADMAKSFQRLAFTLLMALFIFHKFNGNMKGGNLS